MHFKRIFWAKGLEGLNVEGLTEKSLRCDTPEGEVIITVRHATEDEQKRAKHRATNVLCESTLEKAPKDKIRLLFEAISRREVPDGYDRSWLFPTNLDGEGNIVSVGLLGMDHFPPFFATFCRTASATLGTATSRFMSLLRWKMGLDQGPVSVVGTRWDDGFSFDGAQWFHFPSDIHSTVVRYEACPFSDGDLADITRRLQDGQHEPLPHALFREAWSLRDSNPRSSLLVGVSAAEVAMKHYVSSAVPDARWLVENLPSPPLEKMARDYFRTLVKDVANLEVSKIPDRLLEELKKAVTLRNQIAHKGEYTLKPGSLQSKLLAIRDFLWLLDYFGGSTWALKHVRPETLLGTPTHEQVVRHVHNL